MLSVCVCRREGEISGQPRESVVVFTQLRLCFSQKRSLLDSCGQQHNLLATFQHFWPTNAVVGHEWPSNYPLTSVVRNWNLYCQFISVFLNVVQIFQCFKPHPAGSWSRRRSHLGTLGKSEHQSRPSATVTSRSLQSSLLAAMAR